MNDLQPGCTPQSQEQNRSKGEVRQPFTELTGALSNFTRRSKSYSFEERRSDSPLVEAVWRTPIAATPPTCPENSGPYIFPAVRHWGLVVTRHERETTIAVWGPGTKAAPAPCPREPDLFGILFKPGTFMPYLPLSAVRNRRDVILPHASGQSFWFNGHACPFPDFENAESFLANDSDSKDSE